MKTVIEVLEKYGFATVHKEAPEAVQRKIQHIYKNYNEKYPRSKVRWEKEIMDIYVHTKGGVYVKDKEKFLAHIGKNNYVYEGPEWQLQLIKIGTEREQREKFKIAFGFRNHVVKALIKERLGTKKEEMNEEYAGLFLKHMFDGADVERKIKIKVRKRITRFAQSLNDPRITFKMERDLTQAAWYEYQLAIQNLEKENA